MYVMWVDRKVSSERKFKLLTSCFDKTNLIYSLMNGWLNEYIYMYILKR